MWGISKLYCQKCGAAAGNKLAGPCHYCGGTTYGSRHPKELVAGPDLKLTESDKRFLRSIMVVAE
jgi:hypothetical protein